MRHKLFLIFLLFLALCSCQNYNQFRQQLSLADTLMRTDADSAFRMLCGMDSLAARMPKNIQMEHLLLRCNAQNKADSLFSSDSLGLLLTQYFDQEGTPNQRMLAHYVLGCAYRDMNDPRSALYCFNEAVDEADTTAADCDLYQLSIIYGQIGGIHIDGFSPVEALQAFERSEHYATLLHDSLGIFNIWSNKTNAYIYQQRTKEAVELKEKAADGYQRMGYRREATQTRGLCVDWLSQKGELEKAKRYLDDYVAYSGYFQKGEYGIPQKGCEKCYNIVASYYRANGQLDSAEYYLRRWMPLTEKASDKGLLYEHLYMVFHQKGDIDSVAKYAVMCNQQFDDTWNEYVDNNQQMNQASFIVSRYEKKNLEYQLEAEEYKSNYYMTLILAIVLTIVASALIWGCRYIIKIHRYEIKRCRDKIRHYIGLYNETRAESREKSEVIHSYEQEKSKQKASIDIHKLCQTPPVKQVVDLANGCHRTPTHQELEAMFEVVAQAFPALYEIRANQKIRWDECMLCTLLKLNLNKAQIKSLLELSDSQFTNMRARMYKKLLGEAGGASDFDAYICNI